MREKRATAEKKRVNYYPFGLKHKGYNNITNSLGNSTAQKFGYNGKELNDDLVGGSQLNWHDFGARNYDASLGRWMNLDPLAEEMRRHSPYNYAFNNPVYFIDPDGMAPESPNFNAYGWPPNPISGIGSGIARAFESASNKITNFLGLDKVSFVTEASGKVNIGVQAGVTVKVGGIAKVKADVNLVSVDLVSAKADLTDPINPESYTMDYINKDGNADFTHGIGATLEIADKPVLGADINVSHTSDDPEAKVTGGVYAITPLTETSPSTDTGRVATKGPADKISSDPSVKNQSGKKGEFYGLNLGVGAALGVGVNVNLKIGININE